LPGGWTVKEIGRGKQIGNSTILSTAVEALMPGEAVMIDAGFFLLIFIPEIR
jgi:hypothetical protein